MERVFIVIEPDPIVSMDLVGTLQSIFPRADLSVVASMTQARRLVLKDQGPVNVVANSKLAVGDCLQFLQNLMSTGGKVLFVGEPIDLGFPTMSIGIPFTTDMIVQAVSSVWSEF